MLKARLHFDGDNVGIEKLAREYSLTQDVEDKLNSIPEVIDNVTTDSGTDALSARMGMRLQEQIDNLASRGRYLTTWNAETGLPDTNPQVSPYVYRAGDYYIVGNVSSGTNYRPHGSSYTSGVASQTVESEALSVNDLYIYDGAQWVLQGGGGTHSTVWGSISGTLSNQTDLQNALDEKLNFGDNLAFNDTTTVLVGRGVHSPGGDSCGHWVTIDPKGEVFTHNATTGGYNETTLGNGEIEILHSVSSTSTDYTVTIDHEKLTANDGINTQIYSFLGSNRIATLNDITAHTIPELHTNDVYYDLISTTPGTYKLVDSGKYLGYTHRIPSGFGYVAKPTGGDFTTGGNGILYFKGELNWTYIEGGTIIRSDSFLVGGTGNDAYEFLRISPMAGWQAPAGAYRGQLWYDTNSGGGLKVYDTNNNWTPVGGGGSTYSAGNGISIDANNEISVDTTVVATQTDIANFFDKTSDDADDIDDTNSTNKFVTATEKSTWNGKQDAIQDLSTIRSNAQAGAGAATTIAGYGDIVTHDANEFATAAQGAKADTALQSGDNISELTNDAGYITDAYHDSTKQDKLIAGANIQIAADGKTISATDTTYVAGDFDIKDLADSTGKRASWDAKQDAIPDLATIRSNASTAIQPNDNISELTNDAGYITDAYHDSTKQDVISDLATIRSGAALGATALQSGDDVSELVNDAGYITNAVNDLANYYKKTETYTQAEINALISNFGGFEVVSTLPVSDIKTNVIYLLGPTGTGADKYEEYIYYNSTWTKIGDTSVDLTNYFNTSTQTSDAITQGSTNLFLTSAERTILGNTRGVNTGDQSASDFDIKDLTDSTGLRTTWSGKQDALTAGANIQIDTSTNTISATDTIYTEGEGIEILNMRDYSAMQGPAPAGFHVPLNTEWQAVYNIWTALGGGSNDGTNFGIALKLPFAGRRSLSNANVSFQGSIGYYWSSSYSNTDAYILSFYSTVLTPQAPLNRAYGFSVRCFKNEPVIPTASWALLYAGTGNGGIFWSPDDGLISLSSDLQTWITIADKNLGATTVWNSGNTLSETNAGKYYQRGNNYGFPRTGSVTTSSTQVDASNYGPGNYYNSDTFITGSSDWSNVQNDDLWGGETGVVIYNNAITNTGVLSVNGQTGDVTIQTGGTYTAGDGINISNQNVISVDGTQAGVLVYSLPQHPISLQDEYVYSGTATLGGNTSEIDIFTNRVAIKNNTTGGDQNRVYLDIHQGKGELYVKDKINNVTTEAEYMSDKILSTGANTETYEFQGGGNNQIARLSDLSGKQDKATSGSTAPSTTPTYVGQQYVDTTNDKMYVATGTSSSSDWMEVGAGSGDMLYADFNWASKTGATVTLDLNSTITPSANFTVNAPSTIKDGQIYVLRVTQGATAYTMTLGTNVTNPYGESLTMSAYTVNQFSFLAVGGNLELQPSVTVGESGAKIFYANTGDTGHEISDIGGELETWLNATGQTDDYDTFKDAVLVYDGVTYNRRNTFYSDSGYKYIYFISRSPNVQNNNNGTSKGYYSLVRFKFSYSSGWFYEHDYSTSYVTTTTQSFLRTDYDYSTPYTPLYNGSPATKKYVDDKVVDKSWQTLTISNGTTTLAIRSILEPTSNFTLNKPATLIDGEEYVLRCVNTTSYTMTLGTGITNPHNVSGTLSGQATDQFVFLAINGTLELQPLVTI